MTPRTIRATRGFTLTEVLLSLALLSLLVLGVFGWATTSARTTAALSEPVRWTASAEAALRTIAWDLYLSDSAESGAGGQPVQVNAGLLQVQARDARLGGAVTHSYTLDNRKLVGRDATIDGASRRRLLVEDVASWNPTLSRDGTTLRIVLTGGPHDELIVWEEAVR